MKIPARISDLCKANHGAALVELALVTPFLLLLFVGAIDLGRVYYIGLQVANAAHAGAEYGAYKSTTGTADIQNAAANAVPKLVMANMPVVTAGCECSDGGTTFVSGCSPVPVCTSNGTTRGGNIVHVVTVTTKAVYTTVVPWPAIPAPFNMSGPSTITLTRSATVRGNYP
ncbi:MAG TPA: TadE/TadG family type IV pilus assembly protein [Terracidiphilus sp.]